MYLITGANGFLGKELVSYLKKSENLITLSRANSDIMVDLSLHIPQLPSLDVVVHCAGKAHSIPKTTKQKQEFYDVNVNGTKHLLMGLSQAASLPKYFIFISSVAVYGLQSGIMVNENKPLAAIDSYGDSKIKAEALVIEWCKKNDVVCTILRLPLLAGVNPPGNLNAMIEGIKAGYYFNIAGGKAKKSVALISDVAKAIPIVANIGGIYNLTDRYHPSFYELSILISKGLGKNKPLNVPYWLACLFAKVGDVLGSKFPINSDKLKKITSDLTFDDSKAVKLFGWNPTPVILKPLIDNF